MKRHYFYLLFLLVFFAAGWSPVDMLPAFKDLKTNITAQLNETFDREISVESVSGNIINQIELNNVNIAKVKKLSEGSIIKAKKIIINYNPFKLAASNGNIIPAISKIVIVEPEILVERSIRDEWNMAGLIPRSKPVKEKERPKPILISATVVITGGYGLYVDHMGWGEDLKGRPFISKIRDFDGEVKLSGNKINLSATATSVIDGSTAFTNTNGNLNIKTGKYRFVVVAKNVDIEKWGYYTLNIPHFKPISGRSDMRLTMTNPPPRKKGLPILFDGQFYIRNGRAKIFDRSFEGINGYVSVHDEDAGFRNLTGYRNNVPVTANGRLYDFTVANYDIKLDIPKTDFKELSSAFPELEGIDLSGKASAVIHVGGNYGHPIFNGYAMADGKLLKQKLTGKFDFYSEGPVLRVTSNDISAYGGRLYAKSIFDFTPSVPFLDVNISGEGLNLKDALPFTSGQEGANLQANIKGSLQKYTMDGKISVSGSGEISAMGTVESNDLNLMLSGRDLNLTQKYIHGKLNSFKGKMYGNMSRDPEKDLTFEGKASFGDSMMAIQPISEASVSFKYKNKEIDISSLSLRIGNSRISVKGKTGIGCPTELFVEAGSAEASDLKVLEVLLPKELTPVSGKLDFSLSISGKVTDEADINPGTFAVSGNYYFRNGLVAYEKLEEARLNVNWTNSRLVMKDSRIRTDSSDVILNGTFEAGGNLNMNISGTLELADLRPMTFKYGRLLGSSKGTCHLEGKMNNPNADVDFDINDLRYNEIMINRVSGRIVYDGKNIFLAKPLDIAQAEDRYVISGKASIEKKPSLSLRLDVLKGNLNTAVSLLDGINSEISAKQIFGVSENQKPVVLHPSKLQLPQRSTKIIYKSDGNKTTVEEVKKAESESLSFGKTLRERAGRQVEGKFLGFLEVKGDINDLSGALDFRVSGGTWESYSFDEIGIKGSLDGGTFEVSSAFLKKGNGLLSVHGFFNPLASASIELTAANMPIDFLSLFMGKGKSFDGRFNMSAYLRGPVSSLSGFASIEADKVNIGGVNLDSITSTIDYSNDTLYFKKMELVTGNRKASISGRLPLKKDGISIGITMEGKSLGLLTIASPDISWISGEGQGFVKITGSLNHPKFNGDLSVNNALVSIKPIESDLGSINSNIRIINNVMSTEGFSAKWAGKWTQGNINKIKLFGSINWDNIFSQDRSLVFDLKLKDGDFTVDFPSLYKGDLEVKNFALEGPLWLSQENPKAPKLSGTFNLSNGVLTLPDMSKKTDLLPLGLNMTLNIQKNSYVAAGDIKNLISTDLSNLILNLELEGQNISILGSLNDPKILGKTTFKYGTVNILNREFSLMSEDRQKEVFASDLDKVKENSAVFQGGSLPNLTLAAEINIKSVEKITSPASKTATYTTTNTLVVSRITGVPFSKEKEEGLLLAFYAFKEDATKQPPELTPAGYDEEEIKVLILPDFIKESLGISENGVSKVDANGVLADYLNSRLNTYLLRGVERNLAKSLELESLTLEYNFGKDLKNMLPTTTKSPTEIGPQETPETMYGIEAVKGFFGRFYIDVKYSQAVQEEALINKAFLNYQLTYKLSPVLSVVYYREPFSFIEQESDYYKVTLKAGYQL